jgi:uncharacterized protein YdhG (YjbR/CyaY superfamily)
MDEINTYLTNVQEPQRSELQRIRKLIRSFVPEATEGISYAMPGFKYKGKYLITYAAFKDHMSLFPGAEAIAELGTKLDGYKTSKGTVQFTLDHPLSDAVLHEMINLRIASIDR